MKVHRSNRTEQLVDILCDVVREPLSSPFAKECIVVQGRGMERWLSMQLAQRLGVWANPEFPFPRALIERAFAAVSGEKEDVGAKYQPETLLWAIAELLPGFLSHDAFAPIRSYLGEDATSVRRMQLAARIAATFDQYVVYRPDMVLQWEQAPTDNWQSVLWHELVRRLGPDHLAARRARFSAAVARGAGLRDFPGRVSLFGLSTLPPLYVDVLFELAKLTEVNLFLLSPSNQYWAEIRSRREQLRDVARATRGQHEPAAEELHLEEGNPLLASLGRLGRDFQFVLEGGGDYVESERELHDAPGRGTLLGTLQADVLDLVERRHDTSSHAGTEPALPLDPDDRSISVHSCHAPMREVEVLHDQLARLFEILPGLQPRDVVVMTPAIDTYAPLVEAVFGETELRPKLPYHLADRGIRSTDAIVDAFSRLLDVTDGRMTATDVLDLLRVEPVRRRFGIAASDVDVVRRWVDHSGIRWGVNEEHRRDVGQPALRENTWRFGLDRLLLGVAMPGQDRTLYGATLPYDDVEGGAAELLGKLAELCETLFHFRERLRGARTIDAWRDNFGSLLDAMLSSDDETADQHNEVKKSLARLAERAQQGGFSGELVLEAVRPLVIDELTRAPSTRGFLSGGITFCEMVPMRAIPFRVVCLLGMNGDAFPRVRRPLGFDLVAKQPRRGDRSTREDDRYLFLEALLSARDRLLITYVGQSIRDNAELPPSVVVSELLDTLGESFVVPDDGTPEAARRRDELPSEHAQRRLRERLVVRHPLQPFSTRYFRGDDTLFSYAKGYHEGAESLVGERKPAPAFVPRPLHLAADAVSVDVADLVRFFQHPPRHFVQRRLMVSLGRDAEPVENREPLRLDELDSWAVGDRVLRLLDEDGTASEIFEALRASGALPPGSLGRLAYAELVPEIDAIAARARELRRGGRMPAIDVDDEIGGIRLTGAIDELFHGSGQVHVQFSRLRRRSELSAWVHHVLLQCFAPAAMPRTARLVGRQPSDGGEIEIGFRDLDDPRALLGELLALYRAGTTRPLPLFASTSRTYAELVAKRQPAETAAERARGMYRAEYTPWADGFDAYNVLAFSGTDPFADAPAGEPSFATVALRVFGPLLEHREARE